MREYRCFVNIPSGSPSQWFDSNKNQCLLYKFRWSAVFSLHSTLGEVFMEGTVVFEGYWMHLLVKVAIFTIGLEKISIKWCSIFHYGLKMWMMIILASLKDAVFTIGILLRRSSIANAHVQWTPMIYSAPVSSHILDDNYVTHTSRWIIRIWRKAHFMKAATSAKRRPWLSISSLFNKWANALIKIFKLYQLIVFAQDTRPFR